MKRYFDEIDVKVKHECGVFGIYDNGDNLDCARLTYYALFALQHRGQESSGIAVNDDGTIIYHKDLGLVHEIFSDELLDKMKGQMAVGHVRYATKGENTKENAQPLVIKYIKGSLTMAYNGNIVNVAPIRKELEKTGAIFQGTSDTETMAYMIARERLNTHSVEDAVRNMMKKIEGAYSICMMSPTKMIAARDPHGMHPLCIGTIGKNSYVIASETVALDAIGAKFLRDVEPGEVILISKDGMKSFPPEKRCEGGLCIFEHVYTARPDSIIDGESVYEARKRAGKFLAQRYPVEADVVIAAPDSGICAALGYAEESGIPYDVGLMKNRYIARTFIQPTQDMRQDAVRIKLNALKTVVDGKKVILVDDSIVRGTTSNRVVKILRDAGATEVHMRIASPPYTHPCYFGTDVSSTESLIAVGRTVEEIREHIGVDTLGYLSLEDLLNIAPDSKVGFCVGCFTGKYPVEVDPNGLKDIQEKGKAYIKKV
ncbi:MAG: amidophosphoribosyltransferase [Clostridia bacterium]|nr:amidophosphoribosyltransferase [Clostridia bacterium]